MSKKRLREIPPGFANLGRDAKRSEEIQALVLEMLGVTGAESENVSHSQLRWLSSEKSYEQEVAALSPLPPKQAQAEARKIMRRLAYSYWHQVYGTQDMNERFDSLWRMAFPEEEKGGKK